MYNMQAKNLGKPVARRGRKATGQHRKVLTAGLQSRVDIFNPLQNLSVGFLFLPERSQGRSTEMSFLAKIPGGLSLSSATLNPIWRDIQLDVQREEGSTASIEATKRIKEV